MKIVIHKNKIPIVAQRPFRVVLLFLLLISVVTKGLYAQSDTNNTNQKPEYNLLFIGNSLTYTNNLPKLVKLQAKKRGLSLKTKMVAFPNYALEDHWNDGIIQELITNHDFDYVIVQQGPSSRDNGREMLVDYGLKLSNLCFSKNAKLCYFMVWPALNNYQDFNKVIENYTEAATANHAILLPVGAVWKAHFEATNTFDFYGKDHFHPSVLGSKKAAEVIVDYLFQPN